MEVVGARPPVPILYKGDHLPGYVGYIYASLVDYASVHILPQLSR